MKPSLFTRWLTVTSVPICARAALHHFVPEIDLVGDMLRELAQHLRVEPMGRPGLYREFRNGYFKRVEAIEFAVNHDDGQRGLELAQAEIVLLGSRG